MRKPLGSPSSRLLFAMLALAVLAGCGKHESDESASTTPPASSAVADAATQAREDAAATAKCEGNPLIKAMPPKTSIGGLPFRAWYCTFNSIRAVYGSEGGKQVEIAVIDTRSPSIDQQADMQQVYHQTFDTQRTMAQYSVQMLVSTIDAARSNPDALNTVGGPDYAPIAIPSSTGEPFLIHVGAQTEVSPAQVVAVFKDRHLLSIQASDKGSAVSGLTAPKAQALYEPFIAQIHPESLP
jgi:hypothetical protein